MWLSWCILLVSFCELLFPTLSGELFSHWGGACTKNNIYMIEVRCFGHFQEEVLSIADMDMQSARLDEVEGNHIGSLLAFSL